MRKSNVCLVVLSVFLFFSKSARCFFFLYASYEHEELEWDEQYADYFGSFWTSRTSYGDVLEDAVERDRGELELKWFEQYLDHFNVLDSRRFMQSYIEEDRFFSPGGLVEIGSESSISNTLSRTQSYERVRKLHGGERAADYLRFPNAEQTLEDLAYFVETIKKTTPGLKHSQVAVFGCSYAGSLATWFRYKYPHIVDAAWASGAPLRAVADFYEYFEVATEVYTNNSSFCLNTIKAGYEEAKKLMSTPEGLDKVRSILGYWDCGSTHEMDSNTILYYIRYVVTHQTFYLTIELKAATFTAKILQRGTDRTNRMYGSTNLQVTKVHGVHGTLHSWHKLGLYRQASEEAPVMLIPVCTTTMRTVNVLIFALFILLASSRRARAFPVGHDDDDDDRKNEVELDEEQEKEAGLEDKWFEQYLDHLNPLDNRTFMQRYIEDDLFFKPGGPLLLKIGGEGVISNSLGSGQIYPLAMKLHGMVFLLEHRYYGKSVPFDNLTAENLSFLTVEQALEDLAYFVETIKKTTPGLENSKVGVFGCSYAGSLATWFRYKFPHIVDAAWASSAPLRAVADFYEYLEVASEVYANTSSLCFNTIKEGYEEARSLMSTPEGLEQVRSILEPWECGNTTEMKRSEILSYIRYVVADHYVPPDHGVESCKLLVNDKEKFSAFKRLAMFLIAVSPNVCYNEDAEYPNDGLAWNYQTCTEFGYTITANSRMQPFNVTSNLIANDVQTCMDQFGEEFSEEVMQRGIARLNMVYGSTKPQVTQVLSIHGTFDPWHKLGLYQQVNEEAPVILIPGTSHCADQNSDEDDPPQLIWAKIEGRKIMAKWLK